MVCVITGLCYHWFCSSLGVRVLKAHGHYFVAVFESASRTNSVNFFRNFYIFIFFQSRKRLCLQFIRGPSNFDKVIIYYFVYIWSSIWRSNRFNHFIRNSAENLWPSILFCTPWHIQYKSHYLCNFHFFRFFFPKFLQELSELLLSSFASYPIILKHFMH